jgi:hypothetical protein
MDLFTLYLSMNMRIDMDIQLTSQLSESSRVLDMSVEL